MNFRFVLIPQYNGGGKLDFHAACHFNGFLKPGKYQCVFKEIFVWVTLVQAFDSIPRKSLQSLANNL